ncbi:MAG TPA: dUTP diphosphatase [Gaiellales bacterium]|nr:dUTP diphosphatase [Gaiellales bacterium]
MIELRFQRLDDAARLPRPAREGDAGLDLSSVQRVLVPAGERRTVGTGLAVAIPPGHAGMVQPRSGLAMRHGITVLNSPGLIDPGYRGELRVVLLNTDREHAFQVEVGDRIAQLVVVAVAAAAPVAVDLLDETARGAAGFGSSGVGSSGVG